MCSYSQPNLLEDSPHSAPGKSTSAQGIHSHPEMGHRKLSPTAEHPTRSQPALNAKQPEVKAKTKKVKKTNKQTNKQNQQESCSTN